MARSLGYAVLLAVATAALVAAGCSGDGGDDASATEAPATRTPTADQSPTPEPTTGATATPTSEPQPWPTNDDGVLQIPSTVQLVDASTGEVITLFESMTEAVWSARFVDGGVEIGVGAERQRFDLDGTRIEEAPASDTCVDTEGGVMVAGREYEGVHCGVVSPDQAWMTYAVDAGTVTLPNGVELPQWDQWVVDLTTGDPQLLQEGLVHCGGCDGRWGPRWSPTSRFVVYSEYSGEDRRFLSDMRTMETRQLGNGSSITEAPAWSPVGDTLLYSSDESSVVVEDLGTGSRQVLDLAWPAAFDRTGSLIYSPAWAPGNEVNGLVTTIVDAETFDEIATLPGARPWWSIWPWSEVTPVALVGDVDVAALQHALGCDGTAIYRGGELDVCIEDGTVGQVARDGRVAVARRTGQVGRAMGPMFETIAIDTFAIDIVVGDGRAETVIEATASFDPPLVGWNAEGTHVLVLWPRSVGL